MLLRDLNDLKEVFGSIEGSFVGVGVTAFSRIAPAFFVPSYKIVCHRKTCDLSLLRKKVPIFSLEENLEEVQSEGLDSVSLLTHPLVQEMLHGLKGPRHMVLYQNYPLLEEMGKAMGWSLIANPAALRLRLAHRSFFKEMLEKIGLPAVPGAILPLGEILGKGYEHWAGCLGPSYVVQLADIVQGGGRGTFFIEGPNSHQAFCERLNTNVWRGVAINKVLVRKYIEGAAASVSLCITGKGLLASRLQRQVIDAPYCDGFVESGIFCGHSWDENPWPDGVASEARRQAMQIGDYLRQLGYRGICGVDFVVNCRSDHVFPLELNPRFTGAFPMLSLLHMDKGIIPMEAVHMLEFLSIPYQLDFEALNEAYMEPVRGGHLLVFLLSAAGRTVLLKGLRPGLYMLSQQGNGVHFLGEASGFRDPVGPSQFVVIEGPQDTGSKPVCFQDNLSRLCRLIFSCPITDSEGKLSSQATAAARCIYDMVVG